MYGLMLRITITEQSDAMTIRLEGRLVGPWVEELKGCWQRTLAKPTGKRLVARLDAVTFVDASGKELLQEMHRAGTKLMGRGVLTRYLLKEIEQYYAP